MPAGARNTPLWIQSPVETVQADNHREVTGYTSLILWWGERLGSAARQVLAAQQQYGVRAVVYRGLFLPSLTVTSKMVLATTNSVALTGVVRYDIQGADDEEDRRRELVITATERSV